MYGSIHGKAFLCIAVHACPSVQLIIKVLKCMQQPAKGKSCQAIYIHSKPSE
jgi:hypothetical protein